MFNSRSFKKSGQFPEENTIFWWNIFCGHSNRVNILPIQVFLVTLSFLFANAWWSTFIVVLFTRSLGTFFLPYFCYHCSIPKMLTEECHDIGNAFFFYFTFHFIFDTTLINFTNLFALFDIIFIDGTPRPP